MKKPFLETVVGRILLFIVPMLVKNQKGIKGTPNADKEDKVFDKLKKKKKNAQKWIKYKN